MGCLSTQKSQPALPITTNPANAHCMDLRPLLAQQKAARQNADSLRRNTHVITQLTKIIKNTLGM